MNQITLQRVEPHLRPEFPEPPRAWPELQAGREGETLFSWLLAIQQHTGSWTFTNQHRGTLRPFPGARMP